MFEIVDSNPKEPYRLFVYGDGGLGKTTMIARAERPIIMAVEKGASRVTDKAGRPVKLMRGIEKFQDVIEGLKWLITQPHDYKTLGLDSSTEIERLAISQIVGNTGKSIITVDKGYGAGDKKSGAMHRELIGLVEELRMKRNMNIIVTGHQKVKNAKDPAMTEDYDTFEPKFQTGEPAGLWKEYVDACLFVRVRTFLKTNDDTKARALTDGTRVAFTTQRPSHYAKNRYGFPEEIDFTMEFMDVIKPYLDAGPVHEEVQAAPVLENTDENRANLYREIVALTSNIESAETQALVMTNVQAEENNIEGLLAIKQRLLELTGSKGA